MPRKTAAAPQAPAMRKAEPFFARPAVLITVLVVMLSSALYLMMNEPQPMPNPSTYVPGAGQMDEQPVKTDTESVILRVSQLIYTNLNEVPKVYTVGDAELVKQTNPLFRDAEQGDKVLKWSDKTVVYSPVNDKLVAVIMTPTTETGMTSSTAMGDETPTETATIEIRNGSGVNGAASRMKKVMTDAGLTVSIIGDAATRPTGTQVIDLSGGTVPNALSKAMGLSNGTAGEMPAGEPASKASILIIIGR